MTPITDSFFHERTYRPACKALSINQGKKEQWLALRQITIKFYRHLIEAFTL